MYRVCSVRLYVKSLQAATRAAEWLSTELSNKWVRLSLDSGEIKLDKTEIERVLARKYAIETASLLKDSFSETHHRISRKRSLYRKVAYRAIACFVMFFLVAGLSALLSDYLAKLVSVPISVGINAIGLLSLAIIVLAFWQIRRADRLELTPEERMFWKMYGLLPDLSEYSRTKHDESRLHIRDSLKETVKVVERNPWSVGSLELAKKELAEPLSMFWKNYRDHLLPFFEEGNEYDLASAVEAFKALMSYLNEPSLKFLNAFNEVAISLPLPAKAWTQTYARPSILSWSRFRENRMFIGLELAFSSILVVGFYLTSLLQKQPLEFYGHLIFSTWFVATVALFVATYLRRS